MTEQSASSSYAVLDVSARLDRIPVVTRSHRIWAALLCAVFLFELADLNTFAYVAPALRQHWAASVSSIGLVTSAAFLGMFVGALIGGKVADALGRKWALIARRSATHSSRCSAPSRRTWPCSACCGY